MEQFEMTFDEVFVEDPNIFQNFIFTHLEQKIKFMAMFTARWGIYDVAGSSIEEFKKFIYKKYLTLIDYYQELINDYEQKITYLNGIVSSETHTREYDGNGSVTKNGSGTDNSTYSELPNKTTAGTYPTNKREDSNSYNDLSSYVDARDETITITKNGDVNILDQKIKYQKYLRNVYLEFVNKFDECFILVY